MHDSYSVPTLKVMLVLALLLARYRRLSAPRDEVLEHRQEQAAPSPTIVPWGTVSGERNGAIMRHSTLNVMIAAWGTDDTGEREDGCRHYRHSSEAE